MSVQFGKCNFDGRPINLQDLDRVRPILAPYGPDGEGFICKNNVGILYGAFHTTPESLRDIQPYTFDVTSILTWDGRLDNRQELMAWLNSSLSSASTDTEIIAAAYQRWGTDSFRKLIGDWALSIWNPADQTLILAVDFVGARRLYYSIRKSEVSWCSVLDPLVLFAGHSFAIEEEYIAGFISSFPAAHLTPYVGIRSVPPGRFIRFEYGRQKATNYWNPDPSRRIRYRRDSEYEEEFRVVFGQACRQRLRSQSAVLAELSGGMDSSSIVCMSDVVIAQHGGNLPLVKTLSFYSDSEPNWNERPYFTLIERQRHEMGCHIDVDSEEELLQVDPNRFAAIPSTLTSGSRSPATTKFIAYVQEHQHRVLLSGIGGDETMGGVPTCLPELRDLLATGRVKLLACQLKAWALCLRKTWFHLLKEALVGFLPPTLADAGDAKDSLRWLNADFAARNRKALSGYRSRLNWHGPLPSFQENLQLLEGLRRYLSSSPSPREPLIEVRYPYLDRNLLEFIFAIPREQLVRPGQRRSLMRRALSHIVPEGVLNRKRKAFVTRTPVATLLAQWEDLSKMPRPRLDRFFSLVNKRRFADTVQTAVEGRELQIVPLLRILAIECWLQHLEDRGIWNGAIYSQRPGESPAIPLGGALPKESDKFG